VSGYASIQVFVNGSGSGLSPLEVAASLESNAKAALSGIAGLKDGGNIELRETPGDIKSQAHFGLYWAHKIRGGVELPCSAVTKTVSIETPRLRTFRMH